MRGNLMTAVLYTIVTTLLFGIAYPLGMIGMAKVFFPEKSSGQLLVGNGVVIGSRILAQPFTGEGYFHPRPSAAGTSGYDASSSGGSNYGPTNKIYVDRIESSVAALQKENPGVPIPIDLVTTSGSGLDPEITPAAADFQAPRIARARGMRLDAIRRLIARHVEPRQFGILGEPRVNVLELNLALDGLPVSMINDRHKGQ